MPLPGAIADEQTANADYLVKAGAATCVRQDDLTAAGLAARLSSMTREHALAMAVDARRVGRGDAATRIAGICLEMVAR